jgi:hypothetical protein
MNKAGLFLRVLIPSTIFLFACSTNDSGSDTSSSGVEDSSSSAYSSSSVIVLEDRDLVRIDITLSEAGDNYADIDGETATYKQADAKNNLKKIDLVAYCGTDMGCKNDSIYSPWAVNLFWKVPYDYLGEYVYLFEIPDTLAIIFKTAKRLYEIIPSINTLISSFDEDDTGVDALPIEEGKAFFVYTTEEKICIVTIKQAGNKSVDLEIIEAY